MTDVKSFISTYYRPAHVPLVLSTCIFGISTQVLNIVILTGRPMRTMPSNILLAGLSLAQLILLTNYAIGTGYDLADTPCNPRTKAYAWLVYLLINVNVNVVFHTIALVHTTLLAVFRYAAVAFPIKCRSLVSERGAKLSVLLAFIMVPIVCATFYANSTVVEWNEINSTNCPGPIEPQGQLYVLKYTENRVLRDYNFIFFGAVCKLLPCGAMIVLSSLLLLELKRVQDKRERLTRGESSSKMKRQLTRSNSSTTSTSSEHATHRQTTVMLVTVVLLLVSVELPQGILNFLSVLLASYEFSTRIYSPLGDLFEMLTVLYSSVNFIIYCAMSSQFRRAFKRLFIFLPWAGHSTLMEETMDTGISRNKRGFTDYSSNKHEQSVRLMPPGEYGQKRTVEVTSLLEGNT